MVWCSVKAQGQLYLIIIIRGGGGGGGITVHNTMDIILIETQLNITHIINITVR
jgi:hypothetical protein